MLSQRNLSSTAQVLTRALALSAWPCPPPPPSGSPKSCRLSPPPDPPCLPVITTREPPVLFRKNHYSSSSEFRTGSSNKLSPQRDLQLQTSLEFCTWCPNLFSLDPTLHFFLSQPSYCCVERGRSHPSRAESSFDLAMAESSGPASHNQKAHLPETVAPVGFLGTNKAAIAMLLFV